MKQEIDTPSIDIREDYLLKKITPEAKEGKAKENRRRKSTARR